jgi:hypothetical protein
LYTTLDGIVESPEQRTGPCFDAALGATAGVLLRRTIPAMGAALVGFVAARLAVEYWVRPNLATPLHESPSLVSTGHFGILGLNASTGTSSLTPPQVLIPNDWVLSTAVVDKAGHALTGQSLLQTCPAYGDLPNNGLPSPAAMHAIHDACITTLSAAFHTVVTYQPASRFWPFQWAEMGIFLGRPLIHAASRHDHRISRAEWRRQDDDAPHAARAGDPDKRACAPV